MQGGQPKQGGQPMQGSQGRRETLQPPGTQQQAAPQTTPIEEMDVDSPTLRWVSIEHPQDAVPIGPDDYVLESVFNPGIDAWEALVLVQPRESEDEDEDEE
ncbi:hypothetical protein G9C85_13995 [Halorubellus sp. JP-L1]|uniref:hypothetical protein n=1 Tax=Halorubellus sp. JP-L1 TaxID=2715753 RepID=UPI001409B919|nr:hypothetical protein [Halorubellus sp. JP-L1]NHN42734.1 hypothetical protein [Halorubellus sp. JP-L1]